MNRYCVLILSTSDKQLDHLLTSLVEAQPDLQMSQIFVVDNGIEAAIKIKWAVNYCKGDDNFVFAKSFNIGINTIPSDFDIFFVCDQGVMLTKGGIEQLRSAAYSGTGIGMAGPALAGKTGDSYNTYQAIGELYAATRCRDLELKEAYNPSLIFLAVYLKRELINKVVPIPENIVTYGYEDQYFCNKAIEFGYDWIINPDVIMAFPEWEGFYAAPTYYSSNLYRKGKALDILNAYYHREETKNLNANQLSLCRHVKQSLVKAHNEISKVTPEVLDIPGMSSPKGRHLLNNLCSLPQASYLEIGSWKGSTLISALWGNKKTLLYAIAIDNWSRCGGPEREFHENRVKFLSGYPLQFYSEDCFSLEVKDKINVPINLYFYDGEHSAQSQKQAFTYYDSVLTDTFITLVDDWNWEDVRRGTYEGFEELKYKILFEIVLPSRWNGDKESWWDGYYLAVIKKS